MYYFWYFIYRDLCSSSACPPMDLVFLSSKKIKNIEYNIWYRRRQKYNDRYYPI